MEETGRDYISHRIPDSIHTFLPGERGVPIFCIKILTTFGGIKTLDMDKI